MPLFRRHDGDLIRGEPPMRRIMPYLMPSRNESIVLHDSTFRIETTRAWLKAYNRTHAQHASLFHVLAYAVGQALHARPELNRFVSGGRLYQRRGVLDLLRDQAHDERRGGGHDGQGGRRAR